MARIVLAEDDEELRKLLVLLLRRRGYEVAEAPDGDTAMKLIKNERTDLALLDITMPGKSGLHIMNELAAEPGMAQIPVLLLTARNQREIVAAGKRLGAKSYILKPFRNADVIKRVAQALGEVTDD